MTQNIFIYFFVANICALKKLEVANDCRGGEKNTEESTSDASDSNNKIKYPRIRKNLSVLRSNESLMDPSNNSIKSYINNSHIVSTTHGTNTHINKSTMQRPLSPKNSHTRTSEGIEIIIILFFILVSILIIISMATVFFLQSM